MEVVQKSMWVPYKPADVFKLVADIQHYPDFLPWCSGAKILKHFPGGVEASLTLHKGSISKSFVTRNLMVENEKIEMHLVSGPFKHLYGVWLFEPKAKGVTITFDMEFSFDNRLIAMMVGPLFHHITHSLLEAFVKRAEVVCTKQE